MRVYWPLDKHIAWFGVCTLSSLYRYQYETVLFYFYGNYPYVTSVRFCKKGKQ